jgi:hypothetical protein
MMKRLNKLECFFLASLFQPSLGAPLEYLLLAQKVILSWKVFPRKKLKLIWPLDKKGRKKVL